MSYKYKEMLYSLPPEKVKDWNGDVGHDSELWVIGSDYIIELESKLKKIKQIIEISNGSPENVINEIKKELKIYE